MNFRTTALSRIALLGIMSLSYCNQSAYATAGGEGAGVESSATRTVTVDDPALQMTAYTLKVPKNWKFTGIISRPAGCHGPSVAADGLTFSALAPDGITTNEKLPGMSWGWTSDGAVSGSCKPVNISTALGFLLNIAVPNLRPDAKDVAVVPLPPQMQQGLQARNRELQSQATPVSRNFVDTARIRLKYTYHNHPVEEMLGAVVFCLETDMPAYPLLHRAAVQRHVCNTTGLIIRRAPQGSLDALMAESPPAAQINPQWDAVIQQRMKSQFAAWQKQNNDLFREIQEHFTQVTNNMIKEGQKFQDMQKTSFENAMAQDRATQAATDHAAHLQVLDSLNRQDFIDPSTGRRVETSNQYSHSWISADGQSVVLNKDPNFDPNGVIDPVRQSWTELIPVN